MLNCLAHRAPLTRVTSASQKDLRLACGHILSKHGAMRAVLFVVLFFAGLVSLRADKEQGIAPAQESLKAGLAATEDEREILRLEKLLQDAWLKHDVAVVRAIVADDFESWSLKGKRHVKADLLRSVENNHEKATKVDDEKVRVFGDTAIYTARITDTVSDEKGASFEATTAVTAVFLRRGGKWQMVQNHDSLLQR